MARKASNGEGTLFQKGVWVLGKNGKKKKVPHGNWFVRFMVGGKLKIINLKTKDYDTARKKHLGMIKDGKVSEGIVDKRLTAIQFLQDWLRQKADKAASRSVIKSSSVKRYTSHVNNFCEYLAETGREHLPLWNLTPPIVNEYLDWRITRTRFHNQGKTKITKAGANRELKFLLGPLDRAFRKGFMEVAVEVGEVIEPFTLTPTRKRLPNPAHIKEVVACIDEEMVRIFTRMISLTGMRPGEGMNLRWCDISFKKWLFHIQPEGEEGWTPKNTSSIRDVPIPRKIYDKLKELRKARRGEPETAYVFLMEDGRPMVEYPNYAYRRLKKAVNKANRLRKKAGRKALPEFTFRRLRHFFISWALTRKVDRLSEIELIKLVGHVDFEMIRTTYFELDLDDGADGEAGEAAASDGDSPQGVASRTGATPLSVDPRNRMQYHESTVHSMREADFFGDE